MTLFQSHFDLYCATMQPSPTQFGYTILNTIGVALYVVYSVVVPLPVMGCY